MEFWELYDIHRQKTGKLIQRGEKVPEGYYHTVVHVCIFNSNGDMLIQQRQPFKQGWPNLWDVTVGGSSVAGDSSIQAAEREVLEELGFHLSLEEQRPALTVSFSFGFDDIYIVKQDLDISTLTLQYEEVQQVKWASRDEIIKMIDERTFISYHKSFINLIFDLAKTQDVHAHFNDQ